MSNLGMGNLVWLNAQPPESNETFHDWETGALYDITRAKALITAEGAPVRAIPIDHAPDDDLDAETIDRAQPDIPGIAVRRGEETLLIDGRHRYAAAFLEGRDHFWAYLLSRRQEIACLVGVCAVLGVSDPALLRPLLTAHCVMQYEERHGTTPDEADTARVVERILEQAGMATTEENCE